MHRLAAPLSVLAAMLISSLVAPPVAAASLEQSAGGEHCVYNLATSTERCFATFTQAIAFATGGAVTDAPTDPAKAAADPTFAERITAASSVTSSSSIATSTLGISFQHADYKGASKIWEASFGCDNYTDVDWQVSNVGFTWNDIISSAMSFNSCQSKYFQHAGFGGYSTPWFGNMSNFGAMNDQASSIQWR